MSAFRSSAGRCLVAPIVLGMVVSFALVWGCGGKTASHEGKKQPQGRGALARVGEEVLTEADLPAPTRSRIEQAERRLFEARLKAAREIAERKLIETAAKKRGVAPEAMEKEALAKVAEPSVEEVDRALEKQPYAQMLEAHAAGAKTDADKAGARAKVAALVAARIRRESHEKARREMLDALAKEAKVEILVEPPDLPRAEISIEGLPARGPAEARVTVVGLADLGPVYCQKGRGAVEHLMEAHPGDVRYVVKLASSQGRPLLRKAVETAACAGEQGKLWEYHDAFCAAGPAAEARAVAQTLGLDMGALDSCLTSGGGASAIEMGAGQAKAPGATASPVAPAFFVNGVAVGPDLIADLSLLYEIETLSRR